MTYKIVERQEIGLPATVTSSDGTPRPPLSNERWVVYHYTGVSSRDYKTADVALEVKRIQQVFGTTKPFEYNYVIGQTEDDAIYEFAGTFQAAHSAGENDQSFGILFLNAVHEPLTPTQIKKAQWLRDLLIYVGGLRAQPEQRPHQQMPGAATACPGAFIMAQMVELVKPYVDPAPIAVPYIPENNQWGPWPTISKRTISLGHVGGDALYLNDAMRLKASQGTCGDEFNPATKRAVLNLQRFFGLVVDGIVGPQTWGLIDMLVKS